MRNVETQHGLGNERSLWLQASGGRWGSLPCSTWWAAGSVEGGSQGEMGEDGGAGMLVIGTVRGCCWWKVRGKTRAVAAGRGGGGKMLGADHARALGLGF